MRSPFQQFLSDILRRWRQKATESEMETAIKDFRRSQQIYYSSEFLRNEIIEMIYQHLRNRLTRLVQKGYNIDRLDPFWKDQYVYEDVLYRMYSLIDTWKMQQDLVEGVNLRRLARDGQNLHTAVVVDKTNKAVDMLVNEPIPVGQKTMDEIMTCWTHRWPKKDFRSVFEDMIAWGKTATIYKYDDYLYRKVLRGAWAKIKTYSNDYRKTLEYRLLIECIESRDMCAEGHIARLANVFVGFDDAFQTELSVGEKVGNAMSALARSELSIKEKLDEGRKILTALGLSVDRQKPWLEALE